MLNDILFPIWLQDLMQIGCVLKLASTDTYIALAGFNDAGIRGSIHGVISSFVTDRKSSSVWMFSWLDGTLESVFLLNLPWRHLPFAFRNSITSIFRIGSRFMNILSNCLSTIVSVYEWACMARIGKLIIIWCLSQDVSSHKSSIALLLTGILTHNFNTFIRMNVIWINLNLAISH